MVGFLAVCFVDRAYFSNFRVVRRVTLRRGWLDRPICRSEVLRDCGVGPTAAAFAAYRHAVFVAWVTSFLADFVGRFNEREAYPRANAVHFRSAMCVAGFVEASAWANADANAGNV